LLDRIDLHVQVDAVPAVDLARAGAGKQHRGRQRVAAAREVQRGRLSGQSGLRTNADLTGDLLETHATPDKDGQALLMQAAERLKLSARGYTRVLRVARTIADLAQAATVSRAHVAEALSYRRQGPLG
jgi:magnesium chelatase family protein